jgi:L-galactose dehydrogenase
VRALARRPARPPRRYYGGTVSETVLGDCLRSAAVPRDAFVLATKCGRYTDGFDFSAARVTRSVDESLARLGLDYVDILHCHDIEFTNLDQVRQSHHPPPTSYSTNLLYQPSVPTPASMQIVSETIPALQRIKESGKARFIGITGLPLSIFTYVLDRVPPGSVDLVLSYCHYGINDTALLDSLPYLKSKGVGVITASPLAMGLLTDNGPPEWHPAPEQLKVLL